ncbi:MAG TPA: class III signal peptide-containing protein [archaeon]|nr:class III signal peptide-containing protein [archaeon]
MEERAQGAIEYLLIIGAAILVVAVVIVALTGVLSSQDDVSTGDYNNEMNDLNCLRDNTVEGCPGYVAPTEEP